jgi:hypothetical protein
MMPKNCEKRTIKSRACVPLRSLSLPGSIQLLIYRRREEGVERVTFSSCVRGRPEVGALRTYSTVLYSRGRWAGRNPRS